MYNKYNSVLVKAHLLTKPTFKSEPYKRTQTAALRRLPQRRRSRRGAEVDKGEKESLVYCGSSTAVTLPSYIVGSRGASQLGGIF